VPYDPLMRWEWEGGAVLVKTTAPLSKAEAGMEEDAERLRSGRRSTADARAAPDPPGTGARPQRGGEGQRWNASRSSLG
jgi:hypothetical protein